MRDFEATAWCIFGLGRRVTSRKSFAAAGFGLQLYMEVMLEKRPFYAQWSCFVAAAAERMQKCHTTNDINIYVSC